MKYILNTIIITVSLLALAVTIGLSIGWLEHTYPLIAPTQAPQATPTAITTIERITLDDLLDAIEQVESGGDANARGDWTDWWETPIFSTTDRRYEVKAEEGKYPYLIREALAIGSFQIHKIYVDDVNRILKSCIDWDGKPFEYDDRWDRIKSREMAEIYTTHYTQHAGFHYYTSPEQMARIHNGGPNGWKKDSTLPYWEKVKVVLK